MVNLLYRLTDRPERGLDPSEFPAEEGAIHLVYTHGSILRHNPASTTDKLGGLKEKNIDVLRGCLDSQDVIAIGYSGWNDGLMAALRRCDSSKYMVYWCDVRSRPTSHVASFLRERAGRAAYVPLGKAGAGGFMRLLYEALIPARKFSATRGNETATGDVSYGIADAVPAAGFVPYHGRQGRFDH